MASVRKVILSKKISNVLCNIYPQTSADIVIYNDTSTVADEIAALQESLKNTMTDDGVDEKIKEACDDLYNKIMGITGDDGETIDEAFDTLKEVADYLAEHGSVVQGFTDDIAALKEAIGDEDSGLIADIAKLQADVADHESRIAALEGEIGDEESGLEAEIGDVEEAIKDLQDTVGDEDSGLVKRVTDLETTVGDDESGLVKDVADVKEYAESLIQVVSESELPDDDEAGDDTLYIVTL